MREKVARFMSGRYGMDQLSRFLIWAALILACINIFCASGFLGLLTWAALIFSYIRIFSRNFDWCRKQNYWYLDKTQKIRKLAAKYKARLITLKTHHIYTCSRCRQKIRIPRGHGRVMVRCPKCGNEFIKNS